MRAIALILAVMALCAFVRPPTQATANAPQVFGGVYKGEDFTVSICRMRAAIATVHMRKAKALRQLPRLIERCCVERQEALYIALHLDNRLPRPDIFWSAVLCSA